MQRHILLFAAALLLVFSACTREASDDRQDVRAVTLDGRKVLLHADETWEYADFTIPYFVNQSKPESYQDLNIEDLLPCRVAEVVDGDTISVHFDHPPVFLNAEEKIRLLGVNTPETSPPEYYGNEATKFTGESLLDNNVYLAFDYRLYDDHSRLLAYVYKEEGSCFNSELLSEGYAKLYPEEKIRFYGEFEVLEDTARIGRKGLWAVRPDKVYILRVFNSGYKEYVKIVNGSKDPVNLSGWLLKDEDGSEIKLPDLLLKPDASVKIYSGKDGIENPPEAYYWKDKNGKEKNIWNNASETARLYNPEGEMVHEYCYP